jgi:hypothetical protein
MRLTAAFALSTFATSLDMSDGGDGATEAWYGDVHSLWETSTPHNVISVRAEAFYFHVTLFLHSYISLSHVRFPFSSFLTILL